MIKYIAVTNDFGEQLIVNLNDVEPESGLFITEIEGLGPVKADVKMTDLAAQDGSKYNLSKANKRNIVIHFRFITANVEEARQLTYTYFPLKRKVTFFIETDNRVAEVDGYVESNEPDIFSEVESAVISIVCESAWFNDASPNGTQIIPFSDLVNLFEFEFSDDDSPSIIFSSVETKRENVVTYKGEAETGVVMIIHASGAFTNPTIYNNVTREKMVINTTKVASITGSAIAAGDEIRISTVKSDKYIRLIRGGRSYNILNALDKDATWFTIHPGDNVFSYTAASGELNMSFEIQAQILYQGV